MSYILMDIFRVVLVLVILSGMVVLLVSLHHVMIDRSSLDDKDKDAFRREIEEEDSVITQRSIFYRFLERPEKSGKSHQADKPYRSFKR